MWPTSTRRRVSEGLRGSRRRSGERSMAHLTSVWNDRSTTSEGRPSLLKRALQVAPELLKRRGLKRDWRGEERLVWKLVGKGSRRGATLPGRASDIVRSPLFWATPSARDSPFAERADDWLACREVERGWRDRSTGFGAACPPGSSTPIRSSRASAAEARRREGNTVGGAGSPALRRPRGAGVELIPCSGGVQREALNRAVASAGFRSTSG